MRTAYVGRRKHYADTGRQVTLCGKTVTEETSSYFRHAPADCGRCIQIAQGRNR